MGVIIIILILAFKLLFVHIDKPFWGHHDWNSVVYSNIARNYIRYGFLETKFGQVMNVDIASPDTFSYITHYPPLLPILISFSFRIFGQTEMAARLTVVFSSLILVYFIYRLGKEIHSTFLGILASLFCILTPLFLYFGKLPVHETVVPAVSAFGFWAYVKFIRDKKLRYYYLLLASLVIGGLINWSALYLAVALLYHQIFFNSRKERKILLLIPLSVFIFVFHLLHIRLLGVESSNVFSNVLIRANPYITADLYGFSLLGYLKQELLLARQYFTLPIFFGSSLFVLLFTVSVFKKNLTFAQSIMSALFVYGIIQLVVFVQLSFIHDYMIYYLLPFMVLSSSYAFVEVLKKFKASIVFPIILFALVAFVFLSGLPFTNALLDTSMHKRGYDSAKIINSEVPSKQKGFIGSNSYKEFEEVFINYYSDRDVRYGEKLPEDFGTTFILIVRPKAHDDLDVNSKQLLDKQFKKQEDENFIWYKIN